jgi:RNA polymerase sigma factor (sigma-70 family)
MMIEATQTVVQRVPRGARRASFRARNAEAASALQLATVDSDAGESLPPNLASLLEARDSDARAQSWASFTRTYSDLILRAVRSYGRDHDARMDLYAHVLEELCRDDFRRLRTYSPRRAGRFSYWLAFVVRRLCVDHLRHVYGRNSGNSTGDAPAAETRRARRRLVDLIGEDLDVGRLKDASAKNPESELRSKQLGEALNAALQALPARDLLLLKFRFEDDLPAREVASLMGFPTVFHVYRQQSAVLESLRSALNVRGFQDPRP